MSAEGATKNAAPDAILANSEPPSAAPILPYEDAQKINGDSPKQKCGGILELTITAYFAYLSIRNAIYFNTYRVVFSRVRVFKLPGTAAAPAADP
jgi:hypothetical protein